MALTATLSVQNPSPMTASVTFQDVTYTAIEAGSDGNLINLTLVDPGEQGEALAIVVDGNNIEVSLETSPEEAAELEVQDLTYTAQDAGAAGNDISIEYVAPASGTNALDVNVTDEAIEVSLETIGEEAAEGTLDLTVDIVLTSVAGGAARNTETFTTEVEAAAANPGATVLADFTGTAAAIVCTITPNDGTNNGAVPVDLTTAELAELITTGAVVGKSVTVTDASSLRALQTATGGGPQALAAGGEGDGVEAEFENGVDFDDAISTADDILAAIESTPAADALVSVAVTGTGSNVQVVEAEDNLEGGDDGGDIVTTSEELAIAINADMDASALVEATDDAGDVVQAVQPVTYLYGGEDQSPDNNTPVLFLLTISNSGAATTLSNIKPIAYISGQSIPLSATAWSGQDQSNFVDNVLPGSGDLVLKFAAKFYQPGSYKVDVIMSSPGVTDFKVTTPADVEVV